MAIQAADEPDTITEINVTPLVDIALVLVIIFMAVAPFVFQAGIQVSSSRVGAAKGLAAQAENVTVLIAKDGSLTVNGEKATWENLSGKIRTHLVRSRDKLVMVAATPDNTVGQVVEALDVAKQSGAAKVAILRKE